MAEKSFSNPRITNNGLILDTPDTVGKPPDKIAVMPHYKDSTAVLRKRMIIGIPRGNITVLKKPDPPLLVKVLQFTETSVHYYKKTAWLEC